MLYSFIGRKSISPDYNRCYKCNKAGRWARDCIANWGSNFYQYDSKPGYVSATRGGAGNNGGRQ